MGRGMTSNPKLQAPNPNALPTSKSQTNSQLGIWIESWFGIWDLGVRWDLELGIWDLIRLLAAVIPVAGSHDR